MPLGTSASGYDRPAHRPRLQAPGSGGGAGAPTAPSDVTVVPMATSMTGQGGYPHVSQPYSSYQLWKTWGFAGYTVPSGFNAYLYQFGNTYRMRGTTAVGGDSSYDFQKAFEGQAVNAVNGGATNVGVFSAKRLNDPSIHIYQKVYVWRSDWHTQTLGPFGDWFDDAAWSNITAALGGIAAGNKFLGGDGLHFDLESGYWNDRSGVTLQAGQTVASTLAKVEQRGYEWGTAIYSNFLNADVTMYQWGPTEGSWWLEIILNNWRNAGSNPATDPLLLYGYAVNQRHRFIYGMMRAATTLGATGKLRSQDATFYRNPTQITGASRSTALKFNTQGILAQMSQTLPAASRDYFLPHFGISPTSWAGYDGAAANQPTEPTYTQGMLATDKLYGMHGKHAEYNYGGGYPSWNNTIGINAPNNDYSFPTGRIAGMAAAAVPGNHPDTTAPTLSATKSGSGSTRTISGTAAHNYGIHYIKAYIYPSGTPVVATMTFNLGGGSHTNVANTFMDYTLTLTGVGATDYAIVTAYSTLGHQHSVVVQL